MIRIPCEQAKVCLISVFFHPPLILCIQSAVVHRSWLISVAKTSGSVPDLTTVLLSANLTFLLAILLYLSLMNMLKSTGDKTLP